MSVELRHLRAFRTIAATGSISAAARELGIGQPALSRTLRRLEDAVGVRLVERSTSSLRLSPAGTAMLARVEIALAAVDEALDVARHAVWPLKVGHAWSAVGPLTSRILRAWTAAHADVPIELRQIDDRHAGLTRGLADVAVLRGVRPPEGFRSVEFDREPRVAVLPADHPLAGGAGPLRMRELAAERLVVNRVTGTVTPQLWPQAGRPTVSVRVDTLEDWLFAIAAGQGIGVSAASTEQLHGRPGLTFRPITDAPEMPVLLAWSPGPGHPHREEFVRLALDLVGRDRAGGDREDGDREDGDRGDRPGRQPGGGPGG